MDLIDYLRFPFALLLVLALIAILALVARKYGLLGAAMPSGKKGAARLQVVETKSLGPRHRLILVAHDEQEHLILTGPNGDLCVHSGPRKKADHQQGSVVIEQESE